MIVVGLDIGCDRNIAVSLSLKDFTKYPISEAIDFYDQCEFYEITTDFEGLNKLLSLGDIFIFEPTGSYSYLWHDNLLKAGKEVRLVSHNKISAYRHMCGWSYKDDEHDAVVLAYYGWLNLNNFKAFNRIRRPDLHYCYLKFLEKERINKDIRKTICRGRNLLHREFPEAKSSKNADTNKPDYVWGFIAGEAIPRISKINFAKRLNKSIGTARTNGFSGELIRLSQQIWTLQLERSKIKAYFEEFLTKPDYQWCKYVFDRFEFGTFDRIIFLCQFEPFGQFLDENLKELRIEKKRKKGKSGKYITKRIGLNKFHSLMGKAIYPWSSGDKEGHIVRGSVFSAESSLSLGKPNGIDEKAQNDTIITDYLRTKYEEDVKDSSKVMNAMTKFTDEQLEEIKKLLKDSVPGQVLLRIIDEAIEKKEKSHLQGEEQKGNKRCKQWAKSRIGDEVVKILFKQLIGAYRRLDNR